MTTEGDHRSFYAALYDALTDHGKIDALLEHAEFLNRGRSICYQIAGRDDGEDLFQDVCLRVLNHVGDLNPDNIQNENQFFNWFSGLALQAWRSRIRRMTGMKTCTEKTRQWPDSSDDASPDELDEFLDHAEVCPYHAEILRLEQKEEEEKLRSVFRRVIGLNGHGRIPLGGELQAALADHKRRMKIWKESVFWKGFPFCKIALYNGGKEIASCGNFFDYSEHRSMNELDPTPGLQIRGISIGEDEEVLLGFYALAGVRHEGKELTLQLDNGFTVSLWVKKLSEREFDIRFRCVETITLETERAGDGDDVSGGGEIIDGGSDTESSPASLVPPMTLPVGRARPRAHGWLPIPTSGQASALRSLAFLAIAISSGILAGTSLRQTALMDKDLKAEDERLRSKSYFQLITENLPILRRQTQRRPPDADPPLDATNLSSTGRQSPSAISSPDILRSSEEPMQAAAAVLLNPSPRPKDDSQTREGDYTAGGFTPVVRLDDRNDRAESFPDVAQVLQNHPEVQGISESADIGSSQPLPANVTDDDADVNAKKVELDWQLRSSPDTAHATNHTGHGKILEVTLSSEIWNMNIPVEPIAKSDCSPRKYEIKWRASQTVTLGEGHTTVVVSASFRGADGKPVIYRSRPVEEDDLARAYKIAVKEVIYTKLYNIINPPEKPHSAVVNLMNEGFDEMDSRAHGRAGFPRHRVRFRARDINGALGNDVADPATRANNHKTGGDTPHSARGKCEDI